MIIAIVQSRMYPDVNMVIHGRLDNSGLPDYALYTERKRVDNILRPYIGDDFFYCGDRIYKLYADWGGVLYEYTLAEYTNSNVVVNDTMYIPLSVKAFIGGGKTYLFTNGIDAYKRSKGGIDTESVPLQRVLQTIMDKCNRQDLIFELAGKKLAAGVWDDYLTEECPNEVSSIMYDLGSQCLVYNTEAINYIYANYGEDIASLGPIFSYGVPEDVITLKGCSPSNLISHKWIMSQIDHPRFMFFRDNTREYNENTLRMIGNRQVKYIDSMSYLMDMLDIHSLLDCIYSESCTDFSITFNERDILSATGSVLGGDYRELTSVPMCYSPMRMMLRNYNTRIPGDSITEISIIKNWLDEMFVLVQWANSENEIWFMNLGLFHLYSPSLIPKEFESKLI